MVPTAEASLSEVTDDADDNAFDLKAVRRFNNDGLHGVIGGIRLLRRLREHLNDLGTNTKFSIESTIHPSPRIRLNLG